MTAYRQVVRAGWFYVIAAAACAPASRGAAPDDASLPADARNCGNGVVDHGEECDDGPLNGTPRSGCTVRCLHPFDPPQLAAYTITFPGVITSFVELWPERVAALVEGLDGIQVASYINTIAFLSPGTVATLQSFSMGGRAISVGRLPVLVPSTPNEQSPLWVEVAADGSPHLYFAEISHATIHEIPYPFADGEGGRIVNAQNISPVLVDLSATTGELLVAVISAHSTSELVVNSARLPAPGARLGISVPSRDFADLVDFYEHPERPYHHRLLQMFDDTRTFVSVDIQQFDDAYAQRTPYLISEDSSGTWPWTPVDGDVWQEAALNGPEQQALAALTHPSPIALLTATGDIYIWQFDHSPGTDPEAYVAPFATVAPGTQTIDLLFRDYRANGLWAPEPDGTQTVLMDGDPANIASPALQPINRSLGFPVHHSTKPAPGGELGYFAVDNQLVKLL